jgi:hypothetical protein
MKCSTDPGLGRILWNNLSNGIWVWDLEHGYQESL